MANDRVTLADVAKRAGVSISTVSRALRSKAGVGEKLTRKIRKLSQQMGYRPDVFARSLRTGKTHAICVLFLDDPNRYYFRLLDDIQAAASEDDYSVYLQLARSEERIKTIWPEVNDGRFDGIIIALARPEFIHSLEKDVTPTVLYGQYPESEQFDTVSSDVIGANRMAVDHLVELGHREIGMFCAPGEQKTRSGRLKGFCDAMKKHGLAVREEWIRTIIGNHQGGYEAMKSLLKGGNLPTSIVCQNDLAAAGAMAAVHEAGMRVPQDLSLIGSGNIEEDYLPVRLTTLQTSSEEIGQKLMETLQRRMSEPKAEKVHHVVSCNLLVRESTAPPRSG